MAARGADEVQDVSFHPYCKKRLPCHGMRRRCRRVRSHSRYETLELVIRRRATGSAGIPERAEGAASLHPPPGPTHAQWR